MSVSSELLSLWKTLYIAIRYKKTFVVSQECIWIYHVDWCVDPIYHVDWCVDPIYLSR